MTAEITGDEIQQLFSSPLVRLLRHTLGTQMASAGAPLVAIKEWMGHADIQTTMIYAKWSKDRNAERALVDAAFST